jgi:ubiquinone/menaquinone biosynthesis C-methylase UbiE
MRRPEFLARHGRRPEGWLGNALATVMSWETRRENDAALALLDVQPRERVLEVGFGHGRGIAAAARLARGGLVSGVDHAPDMVAMAARRNRDAIRQGLVDLRQADCSMLPFDAASFDKAWSVHTIYFWNDPRQVLGEIRRVLKPGGRLVLGFRAESELTRAAFPESIYRFYPAGQVRELLLQAGFVNVTLSNEFSGSRGVILAEAS